MDGREPVGVRQVRAVEACRAAVAPDAEVLDVRPVGGGCINQCADVHTTVGRYFLKTNPGADHAFFEAEADGLAALSRSGAVKTPSVVGCSGRDGPADGVPWLLLEWIEEGSRGQADWGRLGRELAALHRCSGPGGARSVAGAGKEAGWGWHADNVIGSLPQPNGPAGSWAAFWSRRRVLPLARELRVAGALSPGQLRTLEAAARRLGDLIGPAAEADGPSLLHGDFWSGNVIFDRRGAPVLVDPATYVGHREVDLAMTRLFGGFPSAFYRAYDEAWPPQPGRESRLPAYQLYPLLVHARLFGGGYVSSAVRAAEAVVGATASPPQPARRPPAGSSHRSAGRSPAAG